MRTIALLLLLVGVLIYLLPNYREIVPVPIPLNGPDATNLAALAVIAGLVGLVWSRR